MIIYISEAIGTFLNVFFTLAIISNVICKNENNVSAGTISLLTTSIGVGLAYLVPCVIFGDISGAHFNPAITIATSILGIFDKRFMWGYILSEAAGAFVAAGIYLICFRNNILKCVNADSKVKLFVVNVDEKQNFIISFIKELFATFFLMFSMLAVTYMLKAVTTESVYILYFLIIVAIGLVFDYTEVSTNPFRDIFSRLIFVPFNLRSKISIPYMFVTIIAPVVGAILAVLMYNVLPFSVN